jgi:hypothetical protein
MIFSWILCMANHQSIFALSEYRKRIGLILPDLAIRQYWKILSVTAFFYGRRINGNFAAVAEKLVTI